MQTFEGFPLPDCLVDNTGSENLTNRLRRLQLNEMKLRVTKVESNHWLQRRGKQYIGFSPHLKQEARRLFTALDTDGSGALSAEELYQPLLASGLVHDKAQVQAIIQKATVGQVLEFREFLELLETGQHSAMKQLAKDYLRPKQRLLPPQVQISIRRRKLILQAYTGDTAASREKGQQVLKAFSSQLAEEHHEEKVALLEAKRRAEAFRSWPQKTARPTAPTS